MSVEYNRAHPDIHQPWAQWSEVQTLHLVLVYNNPWRWNTRRLLFDDAIRHFISLPNIFVYAVELAYGDRPFEVTVNQSIRHNLKCVQVRTTDEMWHKENLINVGVRAFPPDWKYGGYFDADFNTTRHDWALEAIQMLQHHEFVQNFSSYTDITGGGATSFEGHRPFRLNPSFAWNYVHQKKFKELWEKKRGNPGGDTYYRKLAASDQFPFGFPPGATGGGWSWRRSAFDAVGGMLESCILGSGDWHMAFGLVDATNRAAEMKRCTEPYVDAVLQWQQRASKLSRNIGCVDQHVVHHFHGSKSNRQYSDRWHILKAHDFDPLTDLTKDWQGVWKWAGNKPRLRDDVRRYFITRDEDNPMLLGGERELV